MIICIFGLPGAGKTTLLTAFSVRALKGKALSVGHFSFKVPLGDNRAYSSRQEEHLKKPAYTSDYRQEEL